MGFYSLRAKQNKPVKHIELRIKKVGQLFNSLDSSPFIEKDLDDDAVDFMVSHVKDFGLGSDSRILIHFPSRLKGKVRENDIQKAIHNFFNYKKNLAQKNVHMKISEGRKSLIIGILFLASCLLVRELFFSRTINLINTIIGEGLMIGGWVAMWNPISTILYDWWPIHREKKIYDKISGMPVEFYYS